MYTCTHTHTHTHACMNAGVYTHTHTHTHTHACMNAGVYTRTHTHTHTHMHECRCVHTHTHTLSLSLSPSLSLSLSLSLVCFRNKSVVYRGSRLTYSMSLMTLQGSDNRVNINVEEESGALVYIKTILIILE